MDSPTPDSGNAPDNVTPDGPPDNADDGAASDDPRTDVKPRKEEPVPPGTKEEPKKETPEKGTPKADDPAPAHDGDVLLYQGSVSLWLGWRSFAMAIAAVLAGATLLIVGLFKAGWLQTVGVYIGLPLLLAASLMCGYIFLSLRCLRYKITTRLIERERGIIVKRVDRLDLSRVKDVQLVQNLIERMLRIGTIEILSSDRTDPLMRLEAIPKPRPIYEKLSDTVIKISQKRGIIAMDR